MSQLGQKAEVAPRPFLSPLRPNRPRRSAKCNSRPTCCFEQAEQSLGNESGSQEVMSQQIIKLFRGAKVADIPIEQPTKFKLVINLKTAEAMGVTVPPGIIAASGQTDRIALVISASGTFRTWLILPTMSGVGGEADLSAFRRLSLTPTETSARFQPIATVATKSPERCRAFTVCHFGKAIQNLWLSRTRCRPCPLSLCNLRPCDRRFAGHRPASGCPRSALSTVGKGIASNGATGGDYRRGTIGLPVASASTCCAVRLPMGRGP